jgi:nucleoporin SEH1
MSTERAFQSFSHGHQDLVLAADYNFYGTRLVTASSDHRLKVWEKKRDTWELVDSWRAHDAEITEVRPQFVLYVMW